MADPAWVYVNATGPGGNPTVFRARPTTATVKRRGLGTYEVTFPRRNVSRSGCIATPSSNPGGTIVVVPGDNAGLANNQVMVYTTLGQGLSNGVDFTVAVLSP